MNKVLRILHYVPPTQPLPRETEDFLRGGKLKLFLSLKERKSLTNPIIDL